MNQSPLFATNLSLPPRTQSVPSPALSPAPGTMSSAPAGDDRASRAPGRSSTDRPYQSPRLARSRSRPRFKADAPTREFAAGVAEIARRRLSRATELGVSPSSPSGRDRHSLELVVDVPVWSAGCFSDLSTLHALRDKTLAHTHALVAHLMDEHALHASYRLLARKPAAVGYGCIRVAPSNFDSDAGTRAVPRRRTSFVKPEYPAPTRSPVSREQPDLSFDNAVADSDEEESVDVKLNPGYSHDSSGDEDDEDEQDVDSVVKDEVDRNKYREGTAFVMTLNHQLSLIML